jgi:peroxiredoxin
MCMIELGQLEGAHQEFEKRKARVVAVSLDDLETSRETQADFPHLVVVADKDRKMTEALQVLHPNSGHDGGDTVAPTTVVVDGSGTVRWVFRPGRFLTRLRPAEVLAALDEHLPRD